MVDIEGRWVNGPANEDKEGKRKQKKKFRPMYLHYGYEAECWKAGN